MTTELVYLCGRIGTDVMSVLGVNGWNKLFSLKNTRRRNLAVYECIQQSSYNNIITASRTTVVEQDGSTKQTTLMWDL